MGGINNYEPNEFLLGRSSRGREVLSWQKTKYTALTRWVVIITAFLASALTGCNLERSSFAQVLVTEEEAWQALQSALTQLNKPYKLGGQSPIEGFDCSGLIVWAYQQAIPDVHFKIGNQVSSDASIEDLYRWNVELIPPKSLIPGDIVFLANKSGQISHGGLFIEWIKDTLRFVNASSYWGKVVIDEWPLNGEKREQRFAGGGRLKIVMKIFPAR